MSERVVQDLINATINKILDAKLKDRAGVIDLRDVAAKTCAKLDPSNRAPAAIRFGCIRHYRQMVRSIVYQRPDIKAVLNADLDDQQQELYDKVELQKFYAVSPSKIKRREYMTTAERRKVAVRLRRFGESCIEHAGLLDKETDLLIAQGKLEPDPRDSNESEPDNSVNFQQPSSEIGS